MNRTCPFASFAAVAAVVKTNWFLAVLFFFIALAVGYFYARSKKVDGGAGDDVGEPPP